jgi:hypothetical protein
MWAGEAAGDVSDNTVARDASNKRSFDNAYAKARRKYTIN